MKKALFYAAAAALLILLEFLPPPASDVQALSPVTLLTVSMRGGRVVVAADTGDFGVGSTLEAALSDLQQTSAETLYFETTQSVVFTPAALALAFEAANSHALRPATKIYLCEEDAPDAQAAAEFLRHHAVSATLGRLRTKTLRGEPMALPRLLCREGRLLLRES